MNSKEFQPLSGSSSWNVNKCLLFFLLLLEFAAFRFPPVHVYFVSSCERARF